MTEWLTGWLRMLGPCSAYIGTCPVLHSPPTVHANYPREQLNDHTTAVANRMTDEVDDGRFWTFRRDLYRIEPIKYTKVISKSWLGIIANCVSLMITFNFRWNSIISLWYILLYTYIYIYSFLLTRSHEWKTETLQCHERRSLYALLIHINIKELKFCSNIRIQYWYHIIRGQCWNGITSRVSRVCVNQILIHKVRPWTESKRLWHCPVLLWKKIVKDIVKTVEASKNERTIVIVLN